MLQADRATGQLTLDTEFRDAGSSQPGIAFDRVFTCAIDPAIQTYPNIDESGRGHYDPPCAARGPDHVVQWPGVFVSHLIP
jgi:hypothetical protein